MVSKSGAWCYSKNLYFAANRMVVIWSERLLQAPVMFSVWSAELCGTNSDILHLEEVFFSIVTKYGWYHESFYNVDNQL